MAAARPAKADAVELAFLEALHRRLPDSLAVIRPLADLYTAAGRIEDGYRLDLILTRRCPEDGGAWYNLACSQSLLGRPDEAVASLRLAVHHGYADAAWMAKDPDLEAVRHLPEFRTLLATLRSP